jgi:hypothetical protein
MLGPLDIHQYLLAHDVHHEIVRLRRTAFHAGSLAETLGIPPHLCVATHAFRGYGDTGTIGHSTDDVLVVMLAAADTLIDNDETCQRLSDVLRSRVGATMVFEPAGCDLVSRRTDYIASHLSPLLLPADVIVVAHQALADLSTAVVYTATGDAGTALGLRALDLLVLTKASVLPTHRRANTRRRPIAINLDQPAPDQPAATIPRRRPSGGPATTTLPVGGADRAHTARAAC